MKIHKYFLAAATSISLLALSGCTSSEARGIDSQEPVGVQQVAVDSVWADPMGKDMIGKFALNLTDWDELQCGGVLLADKSDYYDEHQDCMHSALILSKSLAPGVLEAINDPEFWPAECVDELESFTSKLRVLETSYDILPEEATLYEIQLGILVREAASALCL